MATVAIFHPEIIARVAIIKARNIVQLSQIRNLLLTSKLQSMSTEGIIIDNNSNTNSQFSFETSVTSE